MKIDADAPNLIVDKDNKVVGVVTMWNQYGLGEVIVQFLDGSASSMLFSELLFPNGVERARMYLNKKEI